MLVPAANLLVAEVNPGRRSATLNVLNFCWSVGAVACSFLVAFAAKRQQVPLLLGLVAGCMLLVLVGIAAMPSSIVEPAVAKSAGSKLGIDWRHRAFAALGALFFIYVGTENGFGLWIASYAKSLVSMTITMSLDDSFFFLCGAHAGKIAGADAAANDRRNPPGAGGIADGLCGNGGAGVVARPAWRGGERESRRIGAFQCLSDYDFALVAGVRTSRLTDRVGHVHALQPWRRIDAVAGRRFVDSDSARSRRGSWCR